MHIVIQVGHHVVYCEGRGNNAIHYNVLLLCYNRVETFSTHEVDLRHSLLPRCSMNTVTNCYLRCIYKRKNIAAHTSWKYMVMRHLHITAILSADLSENSTLFVASMGNKHHIGEDCLTIRIGSKNTITNYDISNEFEVTRFKSNSFRSRETATTTARAIRAAVSRRFGCRRVGCIIIIWSKSWGWSWIDEGAYAGTYCFSQNADEAEEKSFSEC